MAALGPIQDNILKHVFLRPDAEFIQADKDGSFESD